MKTAEISGKVHYIGVNDRVTHKFEGMWPLPAGVSYNSYLVVGSDKAAIIDGVESAYALEQIGHIKAILGDRRPDYLVINHMEPDHSGAIALLLQAFPGMTVVGNAITLTQIEGYYGVRDNVMAVKDGQELSLGEGTTLKFTLTPMVHWPETMVTYLQEEKTLFSGDAFGCFGALNGAVVDSDMDTARYFPEMLRYYSNIVGRYGMFVQRALKKLAGVEIDVICPTHGPVWKSQIARVVDLYDKLSSYTPLDNGVTIVYGTMYGNTQRMAEAAAEALAREGVKDIEVFNCSVTDLSHILAAAFRHRGLIIAAPTYSDGLFPPVNAFMEAIALRGLKNREVLVFGSHTWSQRAIDVINGHLASVATEPVAEAVNNRQAPGPDVLDQCREKARRLAARLV